MKIAHVYKLFPTKKECLKHIELIIWNNIPECPYCRSQKYSTMAKENRYHCNTCNTSYSVTVNTIFFKTKIDLQKWFYAVHQILTEKKSISIRKLAYDIRINNKTAWYMMKRIKKAFIEYPVLLNGVVKPFSGNTDHKGE